MSQQQCSVLYKRQNIPACKGCMNIKCKALRPDLALKYCVSKRFCDSKLYKTERPISSWGGIDNGMSRANCLSLSKRQTYKKCNVCLAETCEIMWPSEAYLICAQRKQCDDKLDSGGGGSDGSDGDGGGDNDDDDKGKTRAELKKAYLKAKKDKTKAWDKYKKVRAKAKETYNKERGPAREKYRDAKDEARNVYREEKIEARAEYKKKVKSAKDSYLEKAKMAESKYEKVYIYYKDAKSAYKKCMSDGRSPVSCRRLKENYERADMAKNGAKKLYDKEIDEAENYRDIKLDKADSSFEKARNKAKKDYEDAEKEPRFNYEKAIEKARKRYDNAKKKARADYDKVKDWYYKAKKRYKDSLK